MALKKEAIKSGITSLVKRFKPKPKPKPKPKSSKSISKTKIVDPTDSFIPVGMQPILSSGKEIAKKVVRPSKYKPSTKQIIGKTAIYGGVPAAGLYMGLTGDGDEDTGPGLNKNNFIKPPEEESLDSLGDILREKTMAIANEAGRATPVFFDYVKAFPSSYQEKISRDPEFAKQMMAGFLAMMQPSEGFVPRNAISDFGQAAMAEGERQEDAMTDQEQLLAMSDEDIKKLQKIQAGSTPIDQTAMASAAALLAQFRKELTSKKDGKLTDLNGNEINLISFLAMFQQTGGDISKLAEMIVAGE